MFEQSITDIEKLRESEAEAPVATNANARALSTRLTHHQFLVDRTIGKTLEQMQSAFLLKHAGVPAFPGGKAESFQGRRACGTAFWRDYLAALRALTIVDPACGSGAFLVAAFDALAAEYLRVTDRMTELDHKLDFDISTKF